MSDNYAVLRGIYDEAVAQAASGKGKERHANGEPFEEQRMLKISRMLRSERGMAYQVCKKVAEGLDLPTVERQVGELLGAMNYLAGIVIFLREQNPSVAEAKGTEPVEYTVWIDGLAVHMKPTAEFKSHQLSLIRGSNRHFQFVPPIGVDPFDLKFRITYATRPSTIDPSIWGERYVTWQVEGQSVFSEITSLQPSELVDIKQRGPYLVFSANSPATARNVSEVFFSKGVQK